SLVDFEDQGRIEAELRHGQPGSREGVCLNNVGTRFEVFAVNFLDQARLCKDKKIMAIPQVLWMVLEPLTAIVGFGQAISEERGADGAVEDENALREDLFDGFARRGLHEEGHQLFREYRGNRHDKIVTIKIDQLGK